MVSRSKSYDKVWAQNGTATDPDLDTTHPLYIANRYATVGWKAEKPPEYWQNFLQQISDAKVLEALVNGILMTDSGVTYNTGAISSSGGKLYVKPASGATQEVMDVLASGYNSKMSSLTTTFDNHNTVGNKHNDDIKTTIIGGGYYKNEVDDFFGSATDPKTIVYHMNRTGQSVHGETPAQLNTLAALAGGTFTGPVIFGKDVVLQVSPNKALHFDSSMGYVGFVSGSYFLAVDGSGNVWYGSPSGVYLCMTVANYNAIEIKTNYLFSLPVPLISMHLEADINDVQAIGSWTLNTASDPTFEVGKGFKVSGNATTVASLSLAANFTLHVVGWNDTAGTSLVRTVDIASPKTYTTLAQILTAAGAGAMTHIKYIMFYPQLTAFQKTSLVK